MIRKISENSGKHFLQQLALASHKIKMGEKSHILLEKIEALSYRLKMIAKGASLFLLYTQFLSPGNNHQYVDC